MKRRATNKRLIPVSLDTRFVAAQIDFLILCIPLGIPYLVVTGTHFIAAGVAEFMFFMFSALYYLILNRFFEASLGQRLLGYKVVPIAGQKPRFFLRFLFGFTAYFLCFFTWLANRHIKDGIYWWDVKSNTRAVPLAYKGPYGP